MKFELIILSFFLIGLSSCDDLNIEIVGFSESQPSEVKLLNSFPKKLRGYYTDEIGNKVKIDNRSIVEYSNGGTIDDVSILSDSLILKKVKKHSILSVKLGDGLWLSQLLKLEDEQLNFYTLPDSFLLINQKEGNITFDKSQWIDFERGNKLKINKILSKDNY